MKALTRILIFFLAFAGIVSCEKTPDGPPLNKPVYEGPDVNMTIEGLKAYYADDLTASGSTALIEYEFIIKGVVIGNDESGNVYKQLYIRDETAAINIGIDQNSIYADYRVGQNVYINTHGLYLVNYGGELQLGYTGDGIAANRIPWDLFTEKAQKDDFPNVLNAQPIEKTFSELEPEDVNQLVRINRIYFIEGGTATFADGEAYGERNISDGSSKRIMVRTSAYSTFAKDILPEGGGDIIALLGRYNDAWQLILRSTDDLLNFGGPIPEAPVEGGVIFYETLGGGYYPSGQRPKIADFDDWDMKAPIEYSDRSGNSDIRSMSGDQGAHVWIPANREAYLTIAGINTSSYENVKLEFKLAANLYGSSDAMNLNALKVSVTHGGTTETLTLPSTPVSNGNGDDGKFYVFDFDFPSAADVVLEFSGDPTENTMGLRLDDIKIYTEEGDGIDL